MEEYRTLYLWGALGWMAAWVILYVVLPKHRRAMLWIGLIAGPGGPAGEYWSFRDYWHAPLLIDIRIGDWLFGIEDYIFSFALAGVCAGVFEMIAHRKGLRPFPRITLRTVAIVTALGLIGLLATAVLIEGVHVNSVHAALLVAIAFALAFQWRHPELLRISFPLSVFAGAAYWVLYRVVFMPLYPGMFEALWEMDALWGIEWGGVPLEEILWPAATMFFCGPLLRACSPAEEAR